MQPGLTMTKVAVTKKRKTMAATALPPEIIASVLSRLPIKSILLFRCVSKPWCAEIDCPYFIKLHLNYVSTAAANDSNRLLLIGSHGPCLIVSSRITHTNYFELVSHYIKIPFTNFHMRGSSNGLLLVKAGYYLDSTMCLFNPSTLKYLVLPDMPEKRISNGTGMYKGISFCLGYDAIHDDYKVFAILAEERTISKIRVYSLKSNSWSTIKDFSPYGVPFPRYKDLWGSYINGALHSILVIEDHRPAIVGREIIALDIEAEACRFIPLPESVDKNSHYIKTNVLGGSLCAFIEYGISSVEIWVMKEYGVKESWSMLLSVTPPIMDPRSGVNPIFYSESELLIICGYDKLVWYDLKAGTTRKSVFSNLDRVWPVEACVGSLVPVHQTLIRKRFEGRPT